MKGKAVVLCDLNYNAQLHKDRAIKIFQEIGMRLIFMDSHEHDIHACLHVHTYLMLFSYSLANTVMSHEDPKSIIGFSKLVVFKDMSRVAKSSPDMWTDIF